MTGPALKVVLMGRKRGAASALRVLVERKYEVVAAISSDPDHGTAPSLVDAAKDLDIPVLPDDAALYRFLRDRSIQVDLVLSYLHGRKISERTIGLPRLGCFNFHPAPLPEYRGLGGYNFAILERQHSFGVSVHWVSPSIDRGDIVQVRRFPIDPDTETALSLEAKSQTALSALFVEFLDLVESGCGIPAIPQGSGRYIDRRAMEEAKRVLPGEAAEAVDRKARAFWFPPFTGAFIEAGQERFTLVPDCILRNLVRQGTMDDRPIQASPPEGGGIPLSVPHMSGREQRYIAEAFASNWLSTVGPNLEAFERDFEARLGLPAVAVSSGTAALHLGLRALGVSLGDTVFCSDLTFVASVNPVRYLGAQPVLIDSEPGTWNMDPRLLARALADHAVRGGLPKAVIVVHLFGQPADMDPILEACVQYGVPVLEDAAEALGALYKGRPAGTLGDAAIFSFNGNKIITTTGGGMLVSRRPEIIAKARFWATQARDPGIAYEHSEMGYNYRLSNVLAGIGRAQLEVLDERVAERRAVAARYHAAFADLPGIAPMPQAGWGLHTNWLSCFLIDEAVCGCSRDGLIRSLAEAGIESRPVWKPMHLQPLYGSCACYGGAVSEDLFRRGICLPSSSSLTAAEQDAVIRGVREAAFRSQLSALGRRLSEEAAATVGEPQPVGRIAR